VWIGTVGALGDFWVRRAHAGFRLALDADELTIHLNRNAADLGSDLALALHNRKGTAMEVRIIDAAGAVVPYRTIERAGASLLLLQPDLAADR
ncbi:MAG: hypothetical protein ACREJU_13060, partial [Nitrospiraceae bacterium]